MGKTVVGVFDSHVDAMRGQQALVDAGFQPACLCVYSNAVSAEARYGPRVYGHGTVAHDAQNPALEQIEQLFLRLFGQGRYPPETAHYREVIRRGGSILSIDVFDEQVESARDAMMRAGAVDIGERVAAWQREAGQTDVWDGPVRRTSLEDRPGDKCARAADSHACPASAPGQARPEPYRGSIPGGARARLSSQAEMPRNDGDRVAHQRSEYLAQSRGERAGHDGERDADAGSEHAAYSGSEGDAYPDNKVAAHADEERVAHSGSARIARPASAAGVSGRAADAGAAGMKGVPASGQSESGTTEQKAEQEAVSAADGIKASPFGDMREPRTADDPQLRSATAGGIPSYEDELGRDYDTRNRTVALPYEDRERGHREDAAPSSDERYQPYDWPPAESAARQRPQATYPPSGWERFKAALHRGWERMGGEHRRHRHARMR